jgi:hypothetical protein
MSSSHSGNCLFRDITTSILSTLSGRPSRGNKINNSSFAHEILSLLSGQKILCLQHKNTLLVQVLLSINPAHTLKCVSLGIHFNNILPYIPSSSEFFSPDA